MENAVNRQDQDQLNQQTHTQVVNGLPVRAMEGNEKLISTSAKSKNGKMGLIIFSVFILVLLGVGAWWYYAQGQAWLALKDVSWQWGQNQLENYQQTADVYLEISNELSSRDDVMNMFLAGGEKVVVDISSLQKNVKDDSEGNFELSLSSGKEFSLSFSTEYKKLADKIYFKPDIDELSALFGAFFALPKFDRDIWIQMDAQQSWQMSLDEEKARQISILTDEYFQDLKDRNIFKVEKLADDESGDKRILVNVKKEKLEEFSLLAIEYSADVYEISSDVSRTDLNYQDYKAKMIEALDKLKKESPDQWQEMQEFFEDIDFILILDKETKLINGLEINFNNIVLKSSTYNTIVSGSIKYHLQAIEEYVIESPKNIQVINSFSDLYAKNTMVDALLDSDNDGLSDQEEVLYGTDPQNPDSDGDGYNDGQEVSNGYNPLGEGELISIPVDNLGDISSNLNDLSINLEQLSKAKNFCETTGGIWDETISLNQNGMIDFLGIVDICSSLGSSCNTIGGCFDYNGVCYPDICNCPNGKVFDMENMNGCVENKN